MFQARVFHIGRTLIVDMLSWPKENIHDNLFVHGGVTPAHETFFIQRVDMLEVASNGLYLPGRSDWQTMPNYTTSKTFPTTAALQAWIEGYTIAYREVNKQEPFILNLAGIEVLPRETVA